MRHLWRLISNAINVGTHKFEDAFLVAGCRKSFIPSVLCGRPLDLAAGAVRAAWQLQFS